MYMHTLPVLPYAYEALEPHIDAATMHLHHDKHHQTYLDKFNEALGKASAFAELDPVELLWNFKSQVEGQVAPDVAKALKNHGGGFVNHNLFFDVMSPKGPRQAVGELAAAITTQFTSFADFQTQFTDLATKHFGAGWAWLVVDEHKKLQMYSTSNQDSPLMDQHYPLLAIDVWEHAYYLKYQNRRPEYLAAIWQVLDWQKIEERYQAALTFKLA